MMTIGEIRDLAEQLLANDMHATVSVGEFDDGGAVVRVRYEYNCHVQLPLPHRSERNPDYCAGELRMMREAMIQSIRCQLDAWEKAHNG